MTKIFVPMFLLLFFMSCQNPQDNCQAKSSADSQSSSSCTPDSGSGPGPSTPPVVSDAEDFDANIKFNNFDAEEQAKVEKAIEIIKKVVKSEEFKQRVLNFSYNGKKEFVDNNGLTNAQIYQKILEGAETLNPTVNHTMDLELELYYSSKSTVGYTYPDVLTIYMNTKFFDSYEPYEVSDNIFHEWTHKLGFDHAASYSESRDYSVPYGLGYLVEELGKKYQ